MLIIEPVKLFHGVWSAVRLDECHHHVGSALGPHPYPSMVWEFQAVIGREARSQFRRLAGRDPDAAERVARENRRRTLNLRIKMLRAAPSNTS